MSDMKCPFCQQKIENFFVENRSVFACCNLNCKGYFMNAPKELWQELIRTRKALGVAVDALKEIDKTRSVANHKIGTQDKTLNSGIVFCWTTPDEIHNALEQITTLEQKD